jgi:hypothetical protein
LRKDKSRNFDAEGAKSKDKFRKDRENYCTMRVRLTVWVRPAELAFTVRL